MIPAHIRTALKVLAAVWTILPLAFWGLIVLTERYGAPAPLIALFCVGVLCAAALLGLHVFERVRAAR